VVTPRKGDLIWLNSTPQAGHEQAGRRPALVLSTMQFHTATGLLFACPITSRVRGLPFEVPLPPGLSISGVILVQHARSLDWRMRQAEVVGRVPEDILFQVLDILSAVLEDEE
jgi:mRNA interferase MazF